MKKIVLIGDSLLTNFQSEHLENSVDNKFINLSKDQDNSNSISGKLDTISNQNPDVIVVGFGINDICVVDDIKPGKYAYNITKLIENFGTEKLILLSPQYIDWTKNPDYPWTRQVQFELITENISKKHNLRYLDILHKMSYGNKDEFLKNDGIHLADKGLNFVESSIAPEIDFLLAQ
ncbi:SGNH/GDSL hydrolase family protein [Companilactobacillus metriopterae]|uniref:SGNH/GDSL hydrolase family protein n=1 Tax=Companilactobacillus metriopterae TaxID=1909267 RepID=UPI00100A34EA|nr:SGNH/GDSL hydrolase family protein [Companilactobacillus metriopterae]